MILPPSIELEKFTKLNIVKIYRNSEAINKDKILKLYGDLETKKFLLHVLLKAQINWTVNSSIFGKLRSAYYKLIFWEKIITEDVSKLSEAQTNAKLLELEPHFIENPCVVEEMPLADFTSTKILSDADDRIIRKLNRLSKDEIIQLKSYANNNNSIAQLLMYFVEMDNGNSLDAEKYLVASARQYPLAKFMLLRNKLYGNKRCHIHINTIEAVKGIDLLSQTEQFYTVLCILLLHCAYSDKMVQGDQLNDRLKILVTILILDAKRKSAQCAIPHGTGPTLEKLSQQIISRYEQLLVQSEEAKADPTHIVDQEPNNSLNRHIP